MVKLTVSVSIGSPSLEPSQNALPVVILTLYIYMFIISSNIFSLFLLPLFHIDHYLLRLRHYGYDMYTYISVLS